MILKMLSKKNIYKSMMLTDQVLIDSTLHSNINNYFNSFLTVSSMM